VISGGVSSETDPPSSYPASPLNAPGRINAAERRPESGHGPVSVPIWVLSNPRGANPYAREAVCTPRACSKHPIQPADPR